MAKDKKYLPKALVRQRLEMVWDLLHNFEGHLETSENARREIQEGKVIVEKLLMAVDQGDLDLGYILK